jgi:hypothetical protein
MILHAPSYTFFLLNSITVVLTYAKLEGDLFFFNWKMVLSPTLLYLFVLTLQYFKRLIIIDQENYDVNSSLKLNRFKLLDHFFHFVLSLLMLFFVGYIAYSQDLNNSNVSKKPLYITVALYLIIQFIYSYVSKSMDNESYLPMNNEKKNASVLTSIMTPILNFLSSSFVFCSGGQCSTIYGSTISAIFGAFGISVSEWLPILDWLTLLLVIVSVVVLYYAKKSLTYKPFILGCVAAVLIFAATAFPQIRYLVYVGNVFMIVAAIWNSRLNKAGFGFGKKKAKV